MTILLVDDNDDSLQITARLLRRVGFTVHAARTAKEASALAAGGSCKIVVSDIGLPDGSGFELMRELKAMYGLKGIALTGHIEPRDEQDALDAGFSRHLAKPITLLDLVRAIKEVAS